MAMTTEFAEISKRTAKPKRKVRGRPFPKGGCQAILAAAQSNGPIDGPEVRATRVIYGEPIPWPGDRMPTGLRQGTSMGTASLGDGQLGESC